MREIDEVHQAEGDGKPAGKNEEKHAIGDAIEQDCEHSRPLAPSAGGSAFVSKMDLPANSAGAPGVIIDPLPASPKGEDNTRKWRDRPTGCPR